MESMLRAYLVVANDFDFQFHSIVFFAWRDTFYEVFQVQGSCIQFILVFAKGQWPINTIQNSHAKADVYVSMRCGGHHNHCHPWVYRGMFFRGVPSLFFLIITHQIFIKCSLNNMLLNQNYPIFLVTVL